MLTLIYGLIMRQILYVLSLFLLTTNITFGNLDCGNESIGRELNNTFDVQWTKDKIRKVCGEPTEIQDWNEEFFSNELNGPNIKTIVTHSLWTYNQGSHTLIEYLSFRNDVLIDIKDGSYGTNPEVS
jgi:hypothetical protein